MKEKIRNYALSLGLSQFGVCSPEFRKQALVFLFPYFVNEPDSSLSMYARGKDYHKVSKEYLLKICSFIKEQTGMDFSKNIYCDISPYKDKEIAFAAGLGFFGKNSLLINPHLGSYFFIGYIITGGLELENDVPMKATCFGCNACVDACPGKAISSDGINLNLCVSNISQKKGELTAAEQKLLCESCFLWGCDRCQQVCPHNKGLPDTALPDFLSCRLSSISSHDLLSLTEKQFKEKYRDYAFAWRGKNTLLRNLKIFDK